MYRRRVLAAGSALGVTALAGCGTLESRAIDLPPVPDDRPEAIYLPGHAEGMEMVETATTGEYAVDVAYSYPHRFWTVTGEETSRKSLEDDHEIHLMASVRDPETGRVLPEVGVSAAIRADDEVVYQDSMYPMLGQQMGVHHGENVASLTDGTTYDVELSVSASPTRRTGAFQDRFEDPATASVSLPFGTDERDEISFEVLDRGGERDALEAMSGERPMGRAPDAESLPGDVATTRAGDVRYAVTLLPSAPAGIDGGPYLVVSPRTRYNGFLLPRMELSGTLRHEGDRRFNGTLTRTLDPDLGYHYGAVIPDGETGGELSIAVDTPPQISRHEGYETAFSAVPAATVTV